MKRFMAPVAAGVLAVLGIAYDARGGITGNVVGIFNDPILSGDLIDVDGTLFSADNSISAVFTGAGSSTMTWGAGNFAPPFESTIAFAGESLVDAPFDTDVLLGTLFFENGTSVLESLIFGGSFSLSLDGIAAIPTFVSSFGVRTTVNTELDPNFDADFLDFGFTGNTFHVFEGVSAAVQIFGRFTESQTFEVTGLGQVDGAGFVGSGPLDPPPPPTVVPEPSTALAAFLGAVLVVPAARRRLAGR
ncbi:MAG: choice-of-anchor K domain-containing protein [Isosphaeraceae bacterium]|nr:choice-of-anchor K domain-containing protein [Isosphaeraceae bacterium]